MIGMGVIGEYIGRIFIESKRRPLYLVREAIGFDAGEELTGKDRKPARRRSGMAGGAKAERLGGIGPLRRLALQYLRFGTVGISAAAIHVACFIVLIEAAGAPPLFANAIAFSIAVLLSFIGHFHWTFASGNRAAVGSVRPARAALIRFVAVALIGLALNSLAVYLVVDALALPYGAAIVLMVTVVPGVVFTLSRLWAFG